MSAKRDLPPALPAARRIVELWNGCSTVWFVQTAGCTVLRRRKKAALFLAAEMAAQTGETVTLTCRSRIGSQKQGHWQVMETIIYE